MDNEQRESFLQMKDTEGWQLVEEFINNKIQFHEQQLFSCSLDKVVEHRNQREALRSVLLFIDEKCNVPEV